LAGFGVNFSAHPIPYLAFDTGLGLSVAGWRLGARVRANFLTGQWTPILGAGVTYSAGSGGQEIEVESQGEKAKIEVFGSPYLQLVGGVNYTSNGGFVFMATTGYAILLRESNAKYVSGSTEAYKDIEPLLDGGLVLSVAFGYAF
jgi:hypothetical protein